jgi:hypothetical protein
MKDETIQKGESLTVDNPAFERQPLPVVATPATLLQMAVEQGADIDKLSKLMDLEERWEANKAKKAYHKALADFKADPPILDRNKTVSYENNDGSITTYKHSSLDNVADILGKALEKQGLSFNWTTSQGDGGIITVTCHLTHIMGHSESTSLWAGPDQSGKKNNIQAVGSTVTYLQRYTLRAITGTAEAEMDNDGRGSEPIEKITDEQALELEAMITDNDIDPKRVKAWMAQTLKVNSFADINVNAYKTVLNKIQATIKAKS